MTKGRFGKNAVTAAGALAAGVILVCFFGLLIQSTAAAGTTKGMPALARQINFGPPETVIEGEFIDFFVKDDRLYTIGDGLSIYDIANPIQPVYLGGLEGLPTYLDDIYVAGDYAYIPGFESYEVENGITIVNISEPAQPVRAGFYELTGAARIIIVGQQAYVGYSYSGGPAAIYDGLVILDTSNLTELSLMAEFDMGKIEKLDVEEDFLYANEVNCSRAGCGFSFSIVDVSDPYHPALVEYYVPWPGIPGFDVANGLLFTGTSRRLPTDEIIQGILVYDLSDPTQPEERVFVELNIFPFSVVAEGEIVFAANDEAIWLLDVSDPAQPEYLGHYRYGAQEMQIEGDCLYLLTPGGDIGVMPFNHLSISGWVGQPNGLPAPDLSVVLHTALFNGSLSGTYRFGGLTEGTYTITIYLPGFTYSPTHRTVQLPPSAPGQNFTVLPKPESIIVNPGMSGSLRYTDTQGVMTHLSIPTNTLTATLTLTVTPTLAPNGSGLYFTGHGFTLEAAVGGTVQPAYTFTSPLSLTVELSAGDLLVISDTTAVELYRRVVGSWQAVPETCGATPPPTDGELTRALCRTGTYAVYGPTWQLGIPLVVEERARVRTRFTS